MKWHGWVSVLCALAPVALASPFTEQELQWIRAHPVIGYTTDSYWPVGYIEKGRHRGLTRDYIDHVSRTSGLKFEWQPAAIWPVALQQLESGRLLLTSTVSSRLPEPHNGSMLVSEPYFFGMTAVVTRSSQSNVFSPGMLKGKRVALQDGGYAQRYLQARYPDIDLVPVHSAEQALEAVAAGEVDAALGLDSIMRPMVHRQYLDSLFLSGVLMDLPVAIAMGVSPTAPQLLSIINKSLATLTSRDTDRIVERWIERTDYGMPSWQSLLKHYSAEIAILGIALLLVLVFAHRARTAQRSAQRSADDKSMFLAVMSHEIRTPMNAILSSLELLRRTTLDAQQGALSLLAHDSASNLLELLDGILDIAKLDQQALTLDPQSTDITLLGQSVADIHRLAAETKGVHLTFSGENLAAKNIYVDALRLRQVISNLLSNAVKFTSHGQISLDMALLSSDRSVTTLQVKVSDTGIGIGTEQQARVFTAFAQADRSTTRHYGGTGLGLAICKQLVELMGGQIHLHSVVGQGTEIVVSLPVEIGSVVSSAEIKASPMLNLGKGQTILVVEDQPVNQQIVRLQLAELQYECVIVGDGATALAQLEHSRDFALVLLDCYLPDMDGYEVARRIRQQERRESLRHLPLIAISAATDDAHRALCLDSGFDAILGKPLKLLALGEHLARWASSPQAHGEKSLHELFVMSCQGDLHVLEQALQRGDWVQATHFAHRIRGAALMMRVDTLAEPAHELEMLLRRGPPGEPDARAVRAALEQVSRA